MATEERIGQKPRVTTTSATDNFPIERSGTMRRIEKSDLFTEFQTLIDDSINLDRFKVPVKAASVANVSITVAPSTLDGVTLVAGDRVLLKDQTSALTNGIRIFTAAGAPLLRSTDANASSEVKANMIVTVEEGTVNKDSLWMLTTNGAIVLDTTALVFKKFSYTDIPSDTYANWDARKTASTLPKGWVFISDRSIYLLVIAVNGFSNSGYYLANSLYNPCVYDFASNTMLKVEDSKGNVFYNNAATPVNYILNNSNIVYNKILDNNGNTDLTGFVGNFDSNFVDSGQSGINAVSGAATSLILANSVRIATVVNATAIAGALSYNDFATGNPLTAIMNVGVAIERCNFHSQIPIVLDPSVSYYNKSINQWYSNFDKIYTITGLTTLTFHATYGNIIGIANLTSTNAIETINLFANAPINHPFRVYPEIGLAIKFTYNTGANQPILKDGVDAIIDGTKGEWIEFTYNATTSRYYETNRGDQTGTNSVDMFAVPGDSSERTYKVKATTTDATPGEILIPIPTDASWEWELHVNAVQQSGAAGAAGDSFAYVEQGVAKNLAGTASVPGSTAVNTHADAAASTWTIPVTATGVSFKLAPTGQVNKTIRWTIKLKATQTGFRNFA